MEYFRPVVTPTSCNLTNQFGNKNDLDLTWILVFLAILNEWIQLFLHQPFENIYEGFHIRVFSGQHQRIPRQFEPGILCNPIRKTQKNIISPPLMKKCDVFAKGISLTI